MKIRRLALSLLTVFALLWQGVAAAAMAAAMALPPPPAVTAAPDVMPCHEMAGMDQPEASTDTAAIDHAAGHDCCGSSSHCPCAATCGAAALPTPGFALNLLPSPDVNARAILAVLRDTAPPHPFRPPIAAAV